LDDLQSKHDRDQVSLVLAIDFDGTLVEENPPPMHWLPYAKESLYSLKRAGHTLVLYSARLTPRYELAPTPSARMEAAEFWRTGNLPTDVTEQWDRCVQMRTFLMREHVWDVFDAVWQNPGKPPADKFIDDRFEDPNWVDIYRYLGVPLVS
jgi:hypothetical protein